jgi:NitT/TauT family transport system substrate-binding protein
MRISRIFLTSAAVAATLTATLWSGSAPAADQPIPVNIAVIPTMDAAPLLLAKQNGYFAKQGLDATINVGGTGATIIPTVLSGQFGIGYANVISDLEAIDHGLPLVLIHATYAAPTDPAHDPYRVYVDPKGPIKDPKQLASANIGTSSIKNIAEWTTRKTLENLGVTDFSKLRWTKVTGEEAYSTVKSGEIDAVWLPQPTGAAAIAAGLVPILNTNTGSIPKAVGGYFITSKSFAAAHPEIIAKFNAAIDEANNFATTNPDAGREVLIKEASFDRKLVYAADLNDYPNDPGLDKLSIIADDLVRYDLIRKKPDINTIFWHAE